MYNYLKSCPFCGGKAVVLGCNQGHIVECQDCKARTAYYLNSINTDDESEKMAVAAWNNRKSQIRCCGNCEHSSELGIDGLVYCQVDGHSKDDDMVCDKWNLK